MWQEQLTDLILTPSQPDIHLLAPGTRTRRGQSSERDIYLFLQDQPQGALLLLLEWGRAHEQAVCRRRCPSMRHVHCWGGAMLRPCRAAAHVQAPWDLLTLQHSPLHINPTSPQLCACMPMRCIFKSVLHPSGALRWPIEGSTRLHSCRQAKDITEVGIRPTRESLQFTKAYHSSTQLPFREPLPFSFTAWSWMMQYYLAGNVWNHIA